MSKTSIKDQDHNQARQKLIQTALRLFAEKGFDKATTREICETAGVNLSAIKYYFNDKAGLYQAVFSEPLRQMPVFVNKHSYCNLPLALGLDNFFSDFLAPFTMSEDIGLMMRLRFREMSEPTGALQLDIEAEMLPVHQALIDLLLNHLQLAASDLELQRLTFSIIGMGAHLFLCQDVLAAICPELLNSPQAVTEMAKRLSAYAQAMIAYEATRRAEESHYA